MRHFDEIHAQVIARLGEAGLAEQLIVPASDQQLRSMGDDRYLSLMSLRIFRAGLKHSMVDAKWPAFEEVFYQFDPVSVMNMPDETLEELASDTRLIRHGGKLQAVRINAAEIARISRENGGFGGYIANWPVDNIVGLWAELPQQFSQLGGSSAANFLRMAGKDTFLFTKDVVSALIRERVCSGDPTSKKAKAQVQEAFNTWVDQSQLPLCQVSKILALSTG